MKLGRPGRKTFIHNHADGTAVDGSIRGPDTPIPTALRAADTCVYRKPKLRDGNDEP